MSYILAALKKAERERRSGREVNLDNVGMGNWDRVQQPPAVRRLPWLLLASLLVFLVLMLTVTLWRIQPPESHSAPRASTSQGFESAAIESNPAPMPEPEETSGELPGQLNLEGVIVVNGESARARVFIDGNSYLSGDELSPGVRIQSVGRSSVTLTNGVESHTYFLP